MRTFLKISKNMKDYDDLDDAERDSVRMGMIWGFVGGVLVMLVPMCCLVVIVLAAASQ